MSVAQEDQRPVSVAAPAAPRYRSFARRNFDQIPGIGRVDTEQRFEMDIVSCVLPFKTNAYVCEQLIRWDDIPP